jgi:hypothetical protein
VLHSKYMIIGDAGDLKQAMLGYDLERTKSETVILCYKQPPSDTFDSEHIGLRVVGGISSCSSVQALALLDYYLLPALLQFTVLNLLMAIIFDRFLEIKSSSKASTDPWKLERDVMEEITHVMCGFSCFSNAIK